MLGPSRPLVRFQNAECLAHLGREPDGRCDKSSATGLTLCNPPTSPARCCGFPDAMAEINEQLAERDLVATRKTFRGTHRDELWDLPPTGNRVESRTMITRSDTRR
jgi:hypothetical protein